MAPRFQMKLGVVPDADRLPDSPDTVLVVEPTLGSRARTKGQLYLLVTSTVPGLGAARGDAPRRRRDPGTSTTTTSRRASGSASSRRSWPPTSASRHARERSAPSVRRVPASRGRMAPIGVAIAVVRDHELYVATVGPAEAYLSRGARSEHPPGPGPRSRPPCGRPGAGRLAGRDRRRRPAARSSRPNVMARLGPDALKDALVTLHPQPAVEHLASEFAAAGGTGSDGAPRPRGRRGRVGGPPARALVAVKPPEPLAGRAGPLADPAGRHGQRRRGSRAGRRPPSPARRRPVPWAARRPGPGRHALPASRRRAA